MFSNPYFHSSFFQNGYLGGGPAEDIIPPVAGAPQIFLRDYLYTVIEQQRLSGTFDQYNSNFIIEKCWQPVRTYEELIQDYPDGLLMLVCGAIDEGPSLKRVGASGECSKVLLDKTIRIHFGYQHPVVNPRDIASIDKIVNLIDKLFQVIASNSPNNFTWKGTNTAQSEEGMDTPFVFESMATDNLFETYFVATYSLPLYR